MSRRLRRRSAGRRRIALTVAIPTLVVGLVLALAVVRFEAQEGPPAATVTPVALVLDDDLRIDPAVVATERATVERIIDGDTLVARLAGGAETIRLFGLQARERGQPCAGEATARLAGLAPPGTTVLLHPGPRNDDGQRLLRYVFLADGLSLDATLVAEGLAEAWRRDGQLREAIRGAGGGGAGRRGRGVCGVRRSSGEERFVSFDSRSLALRLRSGEPQDERRHAPGGGAGGAEGCLWGAGS